MARWFGIQRHPSSLPTEPHRLEQGGNDRARDYRTVLSNEQSILQISNSKVSARERLEVAFAAAESEFGVTRLLDPEDVDVDNPDEKSVITYVSSLYDALPHLPDYAKVGVCFSLRGSL